MPNAAQSPWALLALSLVLLVVVAIFRQTWPDKQRWWQLLVPIALAVTAFGLDFFVKTDHEKIASVVDCVIKATVANEPGLFAEVISDDYKDEVHRSKNDLMFFYRSRTATIRVEKVKLRSHVINVPSPDKGSSGLVAVVHLSSESTQTAGAGTIVFVKMKIFYSKINNNWLIDSSEILAINYQPMSWKDI